MGVLTHTTCDADGSPKFTVTIDTPWDDPHQEVPVHHMLVHLAYGMSKIGKRATEVTAPKNSEQGLKLRDLYRFLTM